MGIETILGRDSMDFPVVHSKKRVGDRNLKVKRLTRDFKRYM